MLGHTNLTVEVHMGKVEHFEVAEDSHIRCNGPAHFVAAQIQLFDLFEWQNKLDRLLKWGSCVQMIT